MRERLRTRSAAWLVAIVLTALAFVEHAWAPWRPFFVLYALLCVAIPIALRSPKWSWKKLGIGAWIGVLLLPAALQMFAGLWTQVLTPTLVQLAGVPQARLADPAFAVGTALPAAIASAAQVWDTDAETLVLAYVFAIALWAGIGEELFYRGYVHGTLRERGSIRAAYLGSATLFAARHAVQLVGLEPYPLVAAASWVTLSFVIGLVLSALYERSGTIWVPVIVHTLFNGIPLAQLVFTGS